MMAEECEKTVREQVLPHFRTSPVFQEMTGSCCTNHGCPRFTSAVESSRNQEMQSFPHVTVPLVSEEGPTLWRTCLRAEWFTGYRLDLIGGFGGSSRELELAAEIPGDEVPG